MVQTSSTATSAASPATTSKCVAVKDRGGVQEEGFTSGLFCVSAELQESHEQRFPPAEDDGDPAHEQRMPGDPSAKSAGVSTGDKQRGVSLG